MKLLPSLAPRHLTLECVWWGEVSEALSHLGPSRGILINSATSSSKEEEGKVDL